MGLFWNKNKFDICPKVEELKCVVTNYSGHNGTIKINGKVVVPSGYEFVIGKRGKVTDKFDEGEHFFTFSTLPYTCRRFGIDKIDNGKQKDKFVCEYYFVDKGLHAGKFKTYRKVEMGTRAYGIFRAHVYGMYSYRVVNSREFMQSLLNEFDYIKTGEAEDILESWVNELVVAVLEKNNFMIDDVVENKPIIAEKIKQAVAKTFSVAGLEICSLQIYKYKLPRQYQSQSDENIARAQNAEQNKQEKAMLCDEQQLVDEKTETSNTNCEILDKKVETSTENNNNEENSNFANDNIKTENDASCVSEEYVPFGNFVIKNKDDAENIKDEILKNSSPKERTFVDLNLDKLYDEDKQKTKRCKRCGAENNLDADHCILCGEKFFDDEEIL